MPVLQQIPEKMAFKVWNDSSLITAGSFKTPYHGELKHIQIKIHISGAIAGTERIRAVVYPSERMETPIYTSSWSNLSDIQDLSTYWLGFLRLDFNLESLNKNHDYYVNLEINNYIRNGNAFFIGAAYDFPFPIYDIAETNWRLHPLVAGIFMEVSHGLS